MTHFEKLYMLASLLLLATGDRGSRLGQLRLRGWLGKLDIFRDIHHWRDKSDSLGCFVHAPLAKSLEINSLEHNQGRGV